MTLGSGTLGDVQKNRDKIKEIESQLKLSPELRGKQLPEQTLEATSETTISHGLGRTPQGYRFLDLTSDASLTGGQICAISRDAEKITFDNPHSSDVKVRVLIW